MPGRLGFLSVFNEVGVLGRTHIPFCAGTRNDVLDVTGGLLLYQLGSFIVLVAVNHCVDIHVRRELLGQLIGESLAMLMAEGLDHVFARHHRLAEATRRAVAAWELKILCRDPARASNSLTAVVVPNGHDADDVRKVILERFDMSLGVGLGRLAGKVFRIGHLGDLNDLTLAGTLAGVEMGLSLAGVPHAHGGVGAALDYLTETA